MGVLDGNIPNLKKYNLTAWFYDVLDFPWELRYRKWRPHLVGDVHGKVLEAGVGTGRNLRHYPSHVDLTGLDFSPAMLKKALKRAKDAKCRISLIQEDACDMCSVPDACYDWVLATFLCCVIPQDLQGQVIGEIARVLKPGGRFRFLEMVYSGKPHLRRRQNFFAPFVEKVYGARFDRDTLRHVTEAERLKVTVHGFSSTISICS